MTHRNASRLVALVAPVALALLGITACAYGPVSDDAPASAGLPSEDPRLPVSAPPPSSGPWAAAAGEVDGGADGGLLPSPLDAGADADVVVDAAVADGGLEGPADAVVQPPTDASVVVARAAVPGDLVVSEIAFDPAGPQPDSEWFEVASLAADPLELRGVTLKDGVGRTHVVASSVVVRPGSFVVLARSRAACAAAGVPASAIGYEYGAGLSSSSGVLLANGSSGAIELVSGGASLVRVAYGTFGLDAADTSLELRALTYQATPGAALYCVATATSPGAAPRCP
ncbi:MAG: lamin tail domain-containing protein [Myxococcales bacterium]|nr:lamin tail domain-containing protein [Myxococcales bacterium]